MRNDICVSVLCTAYNHEKYLRRCLDGFLMQKTDFRFEVLVNDDVSTDHTADILREYAARCPDIIRPVFQTENQYSRGKLINLEILLPLARGKYIALCEGDDFWTDPYKLQKQVNALEAHPDCHLCVHTVQCVHEDGSPSDEVIPAQRIESGVLSPKEMEALLIEYECPFQTGSYFMRADALTAFAQPIPEFRRISPVGDVCYLLYFTHLGGAFYIAEPMSCYRRNSVGSWTQRNMEKTNAQRTEHFRKMIAVMRAFDRYTGGAHAALCAQKIWTYQTYIALFTGEHEAFRRLVRRENRTFFRREDLCTRLLIVCGAYAPGALRLYRRTKALFQHGSKE